MKLSVTMFQYVKEFAILTLRKLIKCFRNTFMIRFGSSDDKIIVGCWDFWFLGHGLTIGVENWWYLENSEWDLEYEIACIQEFLSVKLEELMNRALKLLFIFSNKWKDKLFVNKWIPKD